MTRLFLALPAFLLTLAACEPVEILPTEPNGGIGDTADTCGAQELRTLVGEHASALDTVRLSQPFRIIRSGEAVTMDFVAERVNFELDARDHIARIFCG